MAIAQLSTSMDYLIMAGSGLAAFSLIDLWLARRPRPSRIPWPAWLALVVLIGIGHRTVNDGSDSATSYVGILTLCMTASLLLWAWMNETLKQRVDDLRSERAQAEALDIRVRERTAELERARAAFQSEMTEHQRTRAELIEMQQKLLSTSREAGQAEIASTVLHNVGNVLNSVNVATQTLTDRLKISRVYDLEKVADILRTNATQLPDFFASDRGRQAASYICSLATLGNSERQQMLNELTLLGRNVDHIREIIRSQQQYATTKGFSEPLDPVELMEDALHFASAGLVRRAVHIARDFQICPPVFAERNKALQILINLIRNAEDALRASNTTEKVLRLAVHTCDDHRVQFIVSDNGSGIAPEHIPRIFQFGFTTKKDGHGFGLHASITAAREMNGDLIAKSDGPGRGASFSLYLSTENPATSADSQAA